MSFFRMYFGNFTSILFSIFSYLWLFKHSPCMGGGGCLHNFLELLFIVEHKAFSELSLMVSRTVFSVELLWRCWRDGSLMKRSANTRVAFLFFLSCLLTLILSPTEKFVPTLSAILGSKDLNDSMTTTPLGSTSISHWFSNR